MSHTKTAPSHDAKGSKTPRTHLGDLSAIGHELSKEEIELVAGGIKPPGGKQPGDDDATYVPGVPHHWD